MRDTVLGEGPGSGPVGVDPTILRPFLRYFKLITRKEERRPGAAVGGFDFREALAARGSERQHVVSGAVFFLAGDPADLAGEFMAADPGRLPPLEIEDELFSGPAQCAVAELPLYWVEFQDQPMRGRWQLLA